MRPKLPVRFTIHFLKNYFPFKDSGNPFLNRPKRHKLLEDNYDLIITASFISQLALLSYFLFQSLYSSLVSGYWLKTRENMQLCTNLIIISTALISYGITTFSNNYLMKLLLTDLYEDHVYIDNQISGIDGRKANSFIMSIVILFGLFVLAYLKLKNLQLAITTG